MPYNFHSTVHSIVNDALSKHGFRRLGRKSLYFRINDQLMQYVNFEKKGLLYNCEICIQPLYILNEGIVYLFGDRLGWFSCGHDRHWMLDVGEEQIISSLEKRRQDIISFVIPWFDQLDTSIKLFDFYRDTELQRGITFYRGNQMAFSLDMAIIAAYVQNYEASREYLDRHVQLRKSADESRRRATIMQPHLELTEAITDGSTAVHALLSEWHKVTCESLGI